MTAKKRDLNLDLIRCIAVFCVIAVHFFLNSEFYSTPVIGKRMYLMIMIRTGCMVCVPLFLMLTGYLMNKKTLSLNFYNGIKKVAGIYLLASIACIAFRIYYLKEPVIISEALISIADFSGAPYAWYIEMYIGLFLMIPFLNLIYNNLKNKEQKKGMLLTFFALTIMPTLSNVNDKLLPDYWTIIYPITYYFAGAYIHEFNIQLKKRTNITLFFTVLLASSIFDIYLNYKTVFIWAGHSHWNGIGTFLLSVLVFVFIKNINLDRLTAITRSFIIKISELSLTIYLVSWIFDCIAYSKLNSIVTYMPSRLEYIFITVLFVFAGSTLLSFAINWVYKMFEKAEVKIRCIFDAEKQTKRIS